MTTSFFKTLSLCLIAGMASTLATFSQTPAINANTPRVITSSTGEAITVRLITKTADSVEVIRVSDSKRVKIPFDRLCEADRALIANWNPTPMQSYRPSSVSIAGSPTLMRKSYPSNVAPRYSSGGSGRRGGTYTRTFTQRCTGRTVTVTVPGTCTTPSAPCR